MRLTREQVADIGHNQALAPKESDFKGKKGYWKRPAKVWRTGVGYVDGYKWGFKFKPNEGGKLTREASQVGEMMQDFNRAEMHRQSGIQKAVPRAEMRDADGRKQYVTESTAASVAKRNGWRHSWRAGVPNAMSGPDGMLFRVCKAGWEPLGVRCLGTPLTGSANVSRREIQRDPDGNPWKFSRGEWVRV